MLGQRRNPKREQYWREAVVGQRRSGQSVRAYCQAHGLNPSNFYAWRRDLQQREGARAARPTAGFVPVQVVSEAIIEVVLPSGVMVRAPSSSEPAALARLVAALGSGSC